MWWHSDLNCNQHTAGHLCASVQMCLISDRGHGNTVAYQGHQLRGVIFLGNGRRIWNGILLLIIYKFLFCFLTLSPFHQKSYLKILTFCCRILYQFGLCSLTSNRLINLVMYSHYVLPGLSLKHPTFSPHRTFVGFVWVSEQTAVIPLGSIINWSNFITEKECLLCGTKWLFEYNLVSLTVEG